MANEKSYAKFIDIPDGNGGTERKWLEDEWARQQINGITTNRPFKEDWPTDTTLAAFCAAVKADTDVKVGDSYLGELTCSGLPTGMVNGEVKVDVEGSDNAKILVLTLTSTNLSPYFWIASYAGSTVYGWRSYALENHTHSDKADKVSGSNLNNKIALLNSNGNLKSSGVTVDDLTTTYATVATCEDIIDELT